LFFNALLGRGCYDSLFSAITVRDRIAPMSLMRHRRYCGGALVVLQKNGKVARQPIRDLVTANGARHD
jgi:hypothetical protein